MPSLNERVTKLEQEYRRLADGVDLNNQQTKEMYEVFNMGHRMEIYTNAEGASLIEEEAKAFDLGVRVVGRVERGREGKNELLIASPEGTLSWVS